MFGFWASGGGFGPCRRSGGVLIGVQAVSPVFELLVALVPGGVLDRWWPASFHSIRPLLAHLIE